MQWWNSFVAWLGSSDGWRIISGAIIPFLAIIIAGMVAAAIGRGSTTRLLAAHSREASAAAVAALIAAGRRASVWNTLTADERQYGEYLANEADTRVRLLPLPGAAMVANWAEHEINDMRKNSATFSFQAEQSLVDFRDRIVQWRDRPSRAKRLFQDDLDNWRYSAAVPDQDLKNQKQAWTQQQAESHVVHPDPPVAYARPAAPPPPPSQPDVSAPAAVAPAVAPVAAPNAPSASTPASTSASPVPSTNAAGSGDDAARGDAEQVRPALVEPEPVRPEPVVYPGHGTPSANPDEAETGQVERLRREDTAYPAPLPVFRAREQATPPSEDF